MAIISISELLKLSCFYDGGINNAKTENSKVTL